MLTINNDVINLITHLYIASVYFRNLKVYIFIRIFTCVLNFLVDIIITSIDFFYLLELLCCYTKNYLRTFDNYFLSYVYKLFTGYITERNVVLKIILFLFELLY